MFKLVTSLPELCYGCGICKCACPSNAIELLYNDNGFSHAVINTDKCDECNLCKNICPSYEWNVNFMKDKNDVKNSLLPFYEMFFAYSNNDKIRYNGASGGCLTTILKYLFDTEKIDGVISPYYYGPLKAEYKILNSLDEILSQQKSKYFCIPFDIPLKEIQKYKNLAFIGLPCHLEAINKWKKLNKLIKYKFGLYCGHVQNKNFYYHLGVNNETDQLHFRPGDWWNLDYFITVNKKGKEKIYPFRNDQYIHKLITSRAFSRDGCLYCPDFMATKSDISFGDGWHNKWKDDKMGYNHIIIRTDTGKKLYKELINKNLISFIPSDVKEFKKSSLYGGIVYKHYMAPKRVTYLKMKNENNFLKNVPLQIDNKYFDNFEKYLEIKKEINSDYMNRNISDKINKMHNLLRKE